jgi:intracellular septation protein A
MYQATSGALVGLDALVSLDRMMSAALSSRGKHVRTLTKVGTKAVPGMILGGVIPAALFLLGRHEWGLAAGIVLVVLWSGGYTAARWIKTRSISGLVILYLIVLSLRGATALAFHSASMFFITPSIVTLIGGCVFIGSALLAKPLVSPIINELVPKSVLDCRDPRVRSVMVKISLLYGVEQLICASVLIVMVENLSTTVYVTTHAVVSYFIMGLMILVGVPFVWKELRALIHWEEASPEPEAPHAVPETIAAESAAIP